jgi:signal transduction histidine kinase/DNA-binding response OmpR family regulator
MSRIEALLRERTTLLSVARVVGGVTDTTEALRLICAELGRLTGADTTAFYMLEDSGTVLRPVAAYHVPKEALTVLAQTPIPAASEPFAETAFGQRQVVWSDDIERDLRFPRAMVRRFPHRSGIVVPLVADGAVVGGFYLVWWSAPRSVAEDERALLQAIGAQAGALLRNSRLYRELEQRAERVRTLVRLTQIVSSTLDVRAVLSAIADAAAQLMGAPYVSFWIADNTRRLLSLAAVSREESAVDFPIRELAFGEGAVGWVAANRKPLNIPDVFAEGSPVRARSWWRARDVTAFLGVPVLLDGELLAVLVLNGRRPFLLEPEDESLVQMFVTEAGIALRNASLYADMARARRDAEAAARAKSDFLAAMSHEIRTPLNGVIGLTELLASTALGPDQRDLVEMLRQSGETLLRLVNHVLDFSKVEAGGLALDEGELDVRAVIEDAVNAAARVAEAKGVEVGAVVSAGGERVLGDADRLRQVLNNLVGNAVKFTEQGHVVVRAMASDRPGGVDLRVEVADTGIGIPDEVQPTLFEPFVQADPASARRYGGTGLGLAISKRLVEAMGGRIGVASRPGVGSTFWFTVPLAVPDGRAPVAEPSLGPARILVVGGGPVARECLRRYLGSWGLGADVVRDAAPGLEALREAAREGRPYDVALLSVSTPGAGPHALAAEIRADPSVAGTRLVLLGAGSGAEESYAAPWDAALTTPIRYGALQSCVAGLLGPPRGTAAKTLARSTAAEHPTLGLRVLVAEDDRTSQTVIAMMLRVLACEAEVVGDGRAAVAAAARGGHDVILMDCQMPGLDGLAATREIRRRSRIPIIATTAAVLPGERERCLAAGSDDYLGKPLTLEMLSRALSRATGGGPGSEDPRPAEPLEPSQPSALDRERISLLREVGRSAGRDLVAELTGAFAAEAPALLEAVRAAIEAGDRVRLGHAGHRLRGASADVGAAEVAACAAEIEARARHGQPSELQALALRLAQALDRAYAALQLAVTGES